MNEHEKSLKLAELMGWKVETVEEWHWPQFISVVPYGCSSTNSLRPYDESPDGRAQFAAILLRFPEVFESFVEQSVEGTNIDGTEQCADFWPNGEPTQANLLDAILRMNGIEP